jgi:hypothetical protein
MVAKPQNSTKTVFSDPLNDEFLPWCITNLLPSRKSVFAQKVAAFAKVVATVLIVVKTACSLCDQPQSAEPGK